MKMKIKFTLFLMLFTAIATSTMNAQESSDKIVMLNGEERIGKVTEINSDNIGFIFKGETLKYTINKSEINKIQFSSGRIEVVNQINNTNTAGANLQDHHNVVAVLPFAFIGDGGANNEQLGKKVQNDCYGVLKKFASVFQLQDPVKTNAMLLKHDIHPANVEAFTPDEICHILGAEYIIMGNITVLYTGTMNINTRAKTEKDRSKTRTNTFSAGTSSTVANYKTQVSMNMYNDHGNNIYSKSHDSFWQTQDAYEITLQWLIKRSPLYRK